MKLVSYVWRVIVYRWPLLFISKVLIIYYNYLLILTFFYERVLVYDLLFLLYFSIYFFHFLLHLFLNENVENIIYDLFISIFL